MRDFKHVRRGSGDGAAVDGTHRGTCGDAAMDASGDVHRDGRHSDGDTQTQRHAWAVSECVAICVSVSRPGC